MIKIDDFNLESETGNELAEMEVERVEAELVTSVEEVRELSLTAINQQKKSLSSQRVKTMLSTDKSKLHEIQKINTATEMALETLTSVEFWENMKESAKTPMDFKFLTEGVQKLMDSRQKLLRLDSVDGSGNAKKISIGVQYEDDSGTKLQTVVKVGD